MQAPLFWIARSYQRQCWWVTRKIYNRLFCWILFSDFPSLMCVTMSNDNVLNSWLLFSEVTSRHWAVYKLTILLTPLRTSTAFYFPIKLSNVFHLITFRNAFVSSTLPIKQIGIHNLYCHPGLGQNFFSIVWLSNKVPCRLPIYIYRYMYILFDYLIGWGKIVAEFGQGVSFWNSLVWSRDGKLFTAFKWSSYQKFLSKLL